jgi:hypothetical protein
LNASGWLRYPCAIRLGDRTFYCEGSPQSGGGGDEKGATEVATGRTRFWRVRVNRPRTTD